MNHPQEQWTPITKFKGFSFTGRYEISSWGNIRNAKTKAPLATFSSQRGQGYLKTKIYDVEGIRRGLYIHQLVAWYYIGEAPEGTELDHIDGNARNNSWTNLRYISHAENQKRMGEMVRAARRKAS
jgi:hypothetical protein